MIDKGAYVDQQTLDTLETPLFFAARARNLLAVRFLLARGANPNKGIVFNNCRLLVSSLRVFP